MSFTQANAERATPTRFKASWPPHQTRLAEVSARPRRWRYRKKRASKGRPRTVRDLCCVGICDMNQNESKPRHSMYAIYACIDPPNPNVGIYGILWHTWSIWAMAHSTNHFTTSNPGPAWQTLCKGPRPMETVGFSQKSGLARSHVRTEAVVPFPTTLGGSTPSGRIVNHLSCAL